VQAVDDEHETAVSVADDGSGIVLTTQCLPSQLSVKFPTDPDPTAMQNTADEHDTAFNWPPGTIGTGIDCNDQLDAPAPCAPIKNTTTTSSTPSNRDPRTSATTRRPIFAHLRSETFQT
jgi:hypothetical protein